MLASLNKQMRGPGRQGANQVSLGMGVKNAETATPFFTRDASKMFCKGLPKKGWWIGSNIARVAA